jgi:hypothetical protein
MRRHIEGEITIALYAINPATQCSKWVAIDADYEDSLADLLQLRFFLRQDSVESALEKSQRGGHLWIFLAEPLPARDCRIYVCGLALRLGIPVKGGKQREGIEVFPKRDIARCPSCAEEGHDRSGDNLSISIEDPRKYICWAGCTRDMIRAAVGCPRPVQHV